MSMKRTGKRRYLAMVGDETLAEHDAKYHPGGYVERQYCKFRRSMAKGDTADVKVAQEKASREFEDWEKECRRRLRGYSERKLTETLHKFDDDNHKELIKLIDDEIQRRWKAYEAERYMTYLGESA